MRWPELEREKRRTDAVVRAGKRMRVARRSKDKWRARRVRMKKVVTGGIIASKWIIMQGKEEQLYQTTHIRLGRNYITECPRRFRMTSLD